jgi:hypothetical protein
MNNLVPLVNSVWRHKKTGDLYQVVLIANQESTKIDEYPVTVVYRRLSDDTIWSRPLWRWDGSFYFIAGPDEAY